MTKINHNLLYFFTTLVVSISAFSAPSDEEQAMLTKAKAAADGILQGSISKVRNNILLAQYQFCKTAQKLLDVQEGAARKKTDRQTIDDRISVLAQIHSLLTIENVLAEIEQQKKFHEAAQQAESVKQGKNFKAQPFKSELAFDCKELVGPENNLRDQKETGRVFNIQQISTDFRKSYDRNAIAKLPAQPTRGRAAVAAAKAGNAGSTQVQKQVLPGQNKYCATAEVQTYAEKIFATFAKDKKFSSMQYPGGVGQCDMYFELVRVGTNVYAIDRKSDRKKSTPNGDLVENGADLYNFLARSRDALPPVAPALKPAGGDPTKVAPVIKVGT